MDFKLRLRDNYDGEEYIYGLYNTLEDALNAAKRVILEDLNGIIRDDISIKDSESLYSSYRCFGDTPAVIDGKGQHYFNASDYAMNKCKELCIQLIDD